VRSGSVEYTWTGVLWLRGKPAYQQPNAASNGRPPCGPADSNPVVATGYNMTVRNHADVSEVLPVCSNEVPPSAPPARDASRTRTVSFVEVPQILGCKRHETKQITTSNGQTAGGSGSDKSPKRVEDAAKLGDENFQIRAIMHASLPTSLPEKVMRLALWNQQAPGNPLPLLLQGLGNYSVAQSEYFYDAPDPRTEWMWNMNWRARLRRFRLPTDSAGSAISAACSTLGGTCSAFVEQAKKLNNIIVH